jgi:2,3,4,5-tetrahydropyridine-2,6-dicarboxylate N-succinyltransferase
VGVEFTWIRLNQRMIPEEAVVVPGSRAISHPAGQIWGLSLYTPIIVKYRDVKTNERVQLERLVR